MIKKKIGAVLGSLMLLAVALPLATAHLTGPSATSEAFTGDSYRYTGDTPSYHNGVSGSYVGNSRNLVLDSDVVFPLVVGETTIYPGGYAATAAVLCDLEVLGDGTTHDLLDEERVDDDPHSGPGITPDGTWDDGGIGGACHTEDQYAHDEYNSPGCGVGGSHAVAEDMVAGGEVWIGASCDTATTSGSGFSLSGCVVNELISGAGPAALAACVVTFVNGAPAPVTSCGSDGFTDAVNYGPGGGSSSATGIPYPIPVIDCSVGGISSVFVFNYISIEGEYCPIACDVYLVPGASGWIDSQDLLDPLSSSETPIVLANYIINNCFDDELKEEICGTTKNIVKQICDFAENFVIEICDLGLTIVKGGCEIGKGAINTVVVIGKGICKAPIKFLEWIKGGSEPE